MWRILLDHVVYLQAPQRFIPQSHGCESVTSCVCMCCVPHVFVWVPTVGSHLTGQKTQIICTNHLPSACGKMCTCVWCVHACDVQCRCTDKCHVTLSSSPAWDMSGSSLLTSLLDILVFLHPMVLHSWHQQQGKSNHLRFNPSQIAL